MSALLTAIIAFLSIIVPGFFLSLALLKKTKLNMFEITVIGFIFGLIFPPTLTWFEAYLMNYIHAFSFSAGLYAANVLFLTAAGLALCFQQGVLDMSTLGGIPGRAAASEASQDYKRRILELRKRIATLNIDASLVREHEREEEALTRRHADEERKARDLPSEERDKLHAMHVQEETRLMEGHEREEQTLLEGKKASSSINYIWIALLALMLFTFATRMMSIGIAPRFFEFDPYFDMQSTEFILTHGYQWLYDHSSWPTAINGTPHRIEPIVPYLEAYWYQIANPPSNQINITLLSNVSSFYPPIAAALLVFIVFLFLYHVYDKYIALFGAVLATTMPSLITTFIAGEQLVEPWGIFAMFFFYAAYLLAVRNMKEKRFAILAGIAFAASFLGAHYYTVIAGVLAIYIALQGVIDVLRKHDTRDFYVMNAIVIGIIALFYLVFNPYQTVLFEKIPSVLGIPVIVSFPLLALILVALFEFVPVQLQKRKLVSGVDMSLHLVWLAIIGIIALLLIYYTPLGKSVTGYLALSSHFTTPSIALFMTVQEFAPTGFNFNFGASGFGIIGASVFGVNSIVWFVLILFTIFEGLAIYNRDSKASILALAAVWPLAIAGMIEIKYLPHFGVGYILAFCAILGELLILTRQSPRGTARKAVFALAIVIALLESSVFLDIFSAASGASCSSINSSGNAIGFDLFCNVVPNAWLSATAWMKQNVGPLAPRILAWWDYGDWINWFGNSNAVLRGDNSIAKLDYQTATRFVFGPQDGYGPAALVNFSNTVAQAKYVLFDDQLTAKWQALDFLACVNVNQTSRAFAIQQANGTGSPYALGTSQCELTHSPAYLLIPAPFFIPGSQNNLNNFCHFSNSSTIAAAKVLISGSTGFLNQTYCLPLDSQGMAPGNPTLILDSNGVKTNIMFAPRNQLFLGFAALSGQQQFADFMALYLPNGPNNTITNAPTQFYSSNYYRGFYLGKLPGFHMVYPSNFTGINYVNSTVPVVIYQVNNYTGSLPKITPKPAWVQNNFTMPG